MNGIWRAVPGGRQLAQGRETFNERWRDPSSFPCLPSNTAFRPGTSARDHTFRAHPYFGGTMHAIVVGVPAAIGVKRAGWHMRPDNDLRALQGHGIRHVLAQETTHFMRANDLVADGSQSSGAGRHSETRSAPGAMDFSA